MQGWHEKKGQKLKVFSRILGEGGIWNSLDKASKSHKSKLEVYFEVFREI